MSTKFAVLGDGAWGTTIALLLAQNPDHEVVLWSAREESGRALRAHRENRRLLPGVAIPDGIGLTWNISEASAGAAAYIAAIPTVYLRATLQKIQMALVPRTPFISLAKGLEIQTF